MVGLAHKEKVIVFQEKVGFAPVFKASGQSCCSWAEDDDGVPQQLRMG